MRGEFRDVSCVSTISNCKMQISNFKLMVGGEADLQSASFDLQFAIGPHDAGAGAAGHAPSPPLLSNSAFGAC